MFVLLLSLSLLFFKASQHGLWEHLSERDTDCSQDEHRDSGEKKPFAWTIYYL